MIAAKRWGSAEVGRLKVRGQAASPFETCDAYASANLDLWRSFVGCISAGSLIWVTFLFLGDLGTSLFLKPPRPTIEAVWLRAIIGHQGLCMKLKRP